MRKRFAKAKKCAAGIQSLALIVSLLMPTFAARREELMFEDIPIVFSAAKMKQRADEAPATVDVITGEEIAAQGCKTLADVLRMIPGVDIIDQGMYIYFSMQGLNARQMNNTSLVLMDGHPYNEIIGGSCDPYLIPMIGIDRIEVVHGPGSALYGANALACVINIITASASKINSVRVHGGVETNQTTTRKLGSRAEKFNESLLFGRQYGDTGVVASFWHRQDNSMTGGNFFPDDQREDDQYFGKIEYKNLAVVYNHLDSKISIASMDPFDGSWLQNTKTTFYRDYISADYKQDMSDAMQLSLRTHYYQTRQVDITHDLDMDLLNVGLHGVVPVVMEHNGTRFGAELQATYKLNDTQTLIAGSEIRDEKSDSIALSGTKQMLTQAVYVQDEWRPYGKLILTAGARYDKADAY